MWTREILLFVSVHEESFIKDLQPTRALSAVTLLRWSHFVLVRWACNWPQPPTRQLISLSYFRFIFDHISVPLMSVHFTLSFLLCEAGVNLRNAKWMPSRHLPLIHSAALKTLKKTLRWCICSLWHVHFSFHISTSMAFTYSLHGWKDFYIKNALKMTDMHLVKKKTIMIANDVMSRLTIL